MFENLTFIEILKTGGVAVYLLSFLSVVSLTVIIDRVFAFRRFKASVAESYKTLKSDGVSAVTLSSTPSSALINICAAGQAKRSEGEDSVIRSMEVTLRNEIENLQSYLGVLGTIGSTAPFIGLFGTVLGIIRAFQSLAIDSPQGVFAVADGISEALVATAAGLFVAIPAVMLYNYFMRRSKRLSLDLERMAIEFIGAIMGKGKSEQPKQDNEEVGR